MTDTLDRSGPEINPLAADPTPPAASPLLMTDAYIEINGVNLRCLTNHLELMPENKPITVTSLCAETDYPGMVKWHLKLKLYQSFDAGATDSVLNAAVAAYQAAGTLCAYKARPHSTSAASPTNPEFAGFVVPQPYTLFAGDAGTASEVDIDWNMTAAPTRNTGAVTATGATAGAPGYFTPPGANTPANLAALTAGITATPSATWGAGQYVITADRLGAYWNGTTWIAGIHP